MSSPIPVPTNRRFYIRTFGCQMNEHDSESIAANLAADGMDQVERPEDADVVVLNTCCIRQNADNKLYGHLGHLKPLVDANPDVQIVVGGCLAQRDREALLEQAPYISVVFGTHNLNRAAELVAEARANGTSVVEVKDHWQGPSDIDFVGSPGLPVGLARQPNAGDAPCAWVTIQVGCDNSCAFCVVPSVRGPEQSRPFGDLIREIESLAASGTSEVTLLGQNVNSYGRDLTVGLRSLGLVSSQNGLGTSSGTALDERHLAGARWSNGPRRPRPLFADLLVEVGSVPGIRRVRFTSPHPKDLRPETIEAMATTGAVCEQLHLPLQSGSDAILAKMRRGYTADRYLERLWSARSAIADLAVTTDLIVGFPGETEDDFVATLEVVAEAGYDSAYTFIFSPRPGTRAAEMQDSFVDPDVVADRFARLTAVVERSALARHVARVGKVEEVLVEGVSKKDAGSFVGKTRQGKLVHFPVSSGIDAGAYVDVLITGAAPHHLGGELAGSAKHL